MRTTNEIIIAVQDCEYTSHEELSLALVALSSIEQFGERKLRELVDEVKKTIEKVSAGHAGDIHNVPLKLRLITSEEHAEFRFKALKNDPKTYLGPDSTPGTPEQAKFHKMALGVLEHVTKGEQNLRNAISDRVHWLANNIFAIKRDVGNGQVPREYMEVIWHNDWEVSISLNGAVELRGRLEGFAVSHTLITCDSYCGTPPYESVRLGQIFLEMLEKLKYQVTQADRHYRADRQSKLPYKDDGTIKSEEKS